jgi:hypothetical protein
MDASFGRDRFTESLTATSGHDEGVSVRDKTLRDDNAV